MQKCSEPRHAVLNIHMYIYIHIIHIHIAKSSNYSIQVCSTWMYLILDKIRKHWLALTVESYCFQRLYFSTTWPIHCHKYQAISSDKRQTSSSAIFRSSCGSGAKGGENYCQSHHPLSTWLYKRLDKTSSTSQSSTSWGISWLVCSIAKSRPKGLWCGPGTLGSLANAIFCTYK